METKNKKQYCHIAILECPMERNMKSITGQKLLKSGREELMTPNYHHLYMKTRHMAGKTKYGKRAMETSNKHGK